MVQRIKFSYYDETSTIGVSRHTFRVDGQEIRLFINFKDFFFEFLDNDGNIVYKYDSKTKNRRVLLNQAKRELKKRGCKFATEKRQQSDKNE